jgi:N-sulfoglucosamine sulfohydrolase
MGMKKYDTIKIYIISLITGTLLLSGCSSEKSKSLVRPNFLLLMSDNHSWNHLGCYGDPVVKTPNIDNLAKQGIRFTNAFCSAPSCTPARASMLTGQDIWRLEEGANLWGILPSKFHVYTDLLDASGYLVGIEGKGWGPGNSEGGGWNRNPGGEKYNSFEEFYNELEKGQPFCYWFSSRDPHRPYRQDGGKEAGIDLNSIIVPAYLPDNDDVRGDMADYYAEIERFDRDVGSYIQLLKEMGQMENTLIITCSDNGWQMPRGLANLYDFGTKIPLIITMPGKAHGDRVVDNIVSLNDLAPTILDLAGIPVPAEMNALSLINMLNSEENGTIEPKREFIVTARERHAYVRKGGLGYGARAIRTNDFLYIKNYNPERWPAGDPPLFGDVDAHMLHYPSPTKISILKNRDDAEGKELFSLAFDKRPAEELYDLRTDPDQMINVADVEKYQEDRVLLARQLDNYLTETKDPRLLGGEMKWIGAKYYAEKDFRPAPSEHARKELGLDEEYSYID